MSTSTSDYHTLLGAHTTQSYVTFVTSLISNLRSDHVTQKRQSHQQKYHEVSHSKGPLWKSGQFLVSLKILRFSHFPCRSLLKQIDGEAIFQCVKSKGVIMWDLSDRLQYMEVNVTTRLCQAQWSFVWMWMRSLLCLTLYLTVQSLLRNFQEVLSISISLRLKIVTSIVTEIGFWWPDKNLAAIWRRLQYKRHI